MEQYHRCQWLCHLRQRWRAKCTKYQLVQHNSCMFDIKGGGGLKSRKFCQPNKWMPPNDSSQHSISVIYYGRFQWCYKMLVAYEGLWMGVSAPFPRSSIKTSIRVKTAAIKVSPVTWLPIWNVPERAVHSKRNPFPIFGLRFETDFWASKQKLPSCPIYAAFLLNGPFSEKFWFEIELHRVLMMFEW